MNDLDRIGLFKEMGYVTIGTPYGASQGKLFSGKNFIVPGSKEPCGNDDGYFNNFQRAFDGEKGTMNIHSLRRMWRRQSDLRNRGKWIPSSGDISLCGFGSRSGGFQLNIPSFSPIAQAYPFVHEKKNFITNPGPKGTGYGYSNICMSKYPEYISGDKYTDFKSIYAKSNEFHELKVAGRPRFRPPNGYGDYFTKNPFLDWNTATRPVRPPKPLDKPFIPSSPQKKDGGMKAGTLNPFPAYMHCPYFDYPLYLKKDIVNDQGKRFLPIGRFPTYFPTTSVLQQNVNLRCNGNNIGNVFSVY